MLKNDCDHDASDWYIYSIRNCDYSWTILLLICQIVKYLIVRHCDIYDSLNNQTILLDILSVCKYIKKGNMCEIIVFLYVASVAYYTILLH